MGRIARNILSIRPLKEGGFLLFGQWHGEQIRKQSQDIGTLETMKARMEAQTSAILIERPSPRMTWLSDDDLRDAESAKRRANGRSLLQCVIDAESVQPASIVGCSEARRLYLEWMGSVRRFPRTIEKNRQRIDDFLRYSKAEYLHKIDSAVVERWALRTNRAPLTQLEDARVLSAWLDWCVRKKYLRNNAVSDDLLANLAAIARPVSAPRILSPDQCKALLDASASEYSGSLIPYTILALWCFMRHAEVIRTTKDNLKLDAKKPVVAIIPRKRGTVSYRNVDIPAQFVEALRQVKGSVFFNRFRWDRIRAEAGLLALGEVKNKKRGHTSSIWQENILRHTGISYLYQKTGDIKEVCRQAGNSDDTAFRHYLDLPREGECESFWSTCLRG